ncbi:hypothetical protein [Burkholderia ubonensis]|uniref:hypothetical protein n=1 Tax=Burkholderia ubonensis TaxID=101571 RepID=UPI0007686E58|nr:hypothetical protein [Burkholderia ubonensis]KVO67323.1 hypothetical protein WJ79_27550 [Burkholderia ubonensis]KVP04226.1 hypothetical protein WJ82_21105 [Burkholderia ubonensis]OJB48172.1 hypothetical protein BGV60_25190 [Burkholderia ubonensis]OJB50845.1 hypothetical protein BGV59_13655 [Burkholderia ubonensis]
MVNNSSETADQAATKVAIGGLRLRTETPPKKLNDGNRVLGRRDPAYDLGAVKTLTRLCGFAVVTEQAVDDVNGISGRLTPNDVWSDDDIQNLIYTLDPDDLHCVEWCATSDDRVILCDAYTIHYNRTRRCRWQYGVKYYIKFGFDEQSDVDAPTLIVSLHNAKY